MLRITIPAVEMWDERINEFVSLKEQTLQLEHSLVSLAKWESKWHKPFLATTEKTHEETLDYIKCMTLTQNVNPEVYSRISFDNIQKINEYIQDPMTATTFREDPFKKHDRRVITAEVIYYWMVSFNIPSEYQKWHLNRLLTLIRVCSAENTPPKKRSAREITSQYAAINAANRKRLNSNG